MGPQTQYLETVLTCKGDFYSPDFHQQLSVFRDRLQQLIFLAEDDRNLILKKVEPWNSVRVTFNIPASAAHRLRELAERRDQILRELGILAVQIDGDHVISLTVSSSEDKLTNASIAIQPKQNMPKKSELPTQDQFFKPPPAPQPVQDINQTVVQQNTSIPAAVVFTPQDVSRTPAVAVVVPSQPGLRPVLIDCRPRVPSSDQSCAPRMDVRHPPASWPMGLAQWSDPRAAAAVLVAAQHPVTNVRPSVSTIAASSSVSSALSVASGNSTNAVAAATVQLAQSKVIPGYIAGLVPNIASSSPLLVNLLQARRGLAGSTNAAPVATITVPPVVPSVSTEPAGAVVPPPPKRRRRQPRKPKASGATEQPKALLNPSLANITFPFRIPSPVVDNFRFPCPVLSTGIPSPSTVNEVKPPVESESTVCDGDSSGRESRQLINPFTGNLETVDEIEDENPSTDSSLKLMLPSPANSLYADNGVPLANTTVQSCSSTSLEKSEVLPSKSTVTVIGTNFSSDLSSQSHQTSSQNIVNPVPPSLVTNSQTFPMPASTSVIMVPASVTTDTSKDTSTMYSCMVDSKLVTASSELLAVDVTSVKPMPLSGLPGVKPGDAVGDIRLANAISSLSGTSVVPVICSTGVSLQLARPAASSANTAIRYPVTSSCWKIEKPDNTLSSVSSSATCISTSGSSILSSAVSHEDLVRIAYSLTLVKQNGRTLLADDSLKPVSSVSSVPSFIRAPSVLGSEGALNSVVLPLKQEDTKMDRITVPSQTPPTSSVVAVSSENCFFPAVSCFPPEKRRKSCVPLITQLNIASSACSGINDAQPLTMPLIRPTTVPGGQASLTIGNWFGVTPSSNDGSKNSSDSAASAGSSSQSVATTVSMEEKQVPVQGVSAPANMLSFNLHDDAVRRLIPNLFPVAVVSSSSGPVVPGVHIMARAPTPVTIDSKSPSNMATLFQIPSSVLSAASTVEKMPYEPASILGVPQFVNSAVDLIAKSKGILLGKSTGKQPAVKERRIGGMKTAEEVQRSAGKSHLTVAQLLEQAKKARLGLSGDVDEIPEFNKVNVDGESLALAQLQGETSSIGSSRSPSNFKPFDLQTNVSVSHMLNSTCAAGTVIPVAKPDTLSSHPLASGNVQSLQLAAFALPQQLPITSPRYPLNLTESVKKVMGTVSGFYPSPPESPAMMITRSLVEPKLQDSLDTASMSTTSCKTELTESISLNLLTDQPIIEPILMDSDSKHKITADVSLNSIIEEATELTAMGVNSCQTNDLIPSLTVQQCPNDLDSLTASDLLMESVVPGLGPLPDLVVSATGNVCPGTRSSENSAANSPQCKSPLECKSPLGMEGVETSCTVHKEEAVSADVIVPVGAEPGVPVSDEPSYSTCVSECDEVTVNCNETTDCTVFAQLNNSTDVHENLLQSSPLHTMSKFNTLSPTSAHMDSVVTDVAFAETGGHCDANVQQTTELNVSAKCADARCNKMIEIDDSNECTPAPAVELCDSCPIDINGVVEQSVESEHQNNSVECHAAYELDQGHSATSQLCAEKEQLLNADACVGVATSAAAAAAAATEPVRQSARRLARVSQSQQPQNCTGQTLCTADKPTIQLSPSPSPVATRMATRSRDRTVKHPGSVDPVSTDLSTSTVKMPLRRTPSKSSDTKVNLSDENTSTAVANELEAANSVSRRSARMPKMSPLNCDTKKTELTAVAVDADDLNSNIHSTGVNLRSRAKVPATSISLPKPVTRMAAKSASSRHTDILSDLSCTSDMVTKSNDNCVRCEINGSQDVS